ncbi:CatB-related O-acetyltransferase [bacterium]|nr:MAG: CatB-related O-acetyltransferase [bacterium]
MLRLLKTLLVILKHNHNSISLDSDISTSIRIGENNHILTSIIYNSAIANNCMIKEASVFSSELANEVTLLSEVILFSAKLENNIHAGSRTAISNSNIGKYTYLAGNNRIFNTTIGAFCSIAENVCIGHAEHPYNHFSTSPVFYKSDNAFNTTKLFQQEINEFAATTIGHDVWIGYNAYIRAGITIGNGCIIGAGAVVTKNIAPYTIVGGVPAKKIKDRFDAEKIKQLEQDQWWNLNDEALVQYAKENFAVI